MFELVGWARWFLDVTAEAVVEVPRRYVLIGASADLAECFGFDRVDPSAGLEVRVLRCWLRVASRLYRREPSLGVIG